MCTFFIFVLHMNFIKKYNILFVYMNFYLYLYSVNLKYQNIMKLNLSILVPVLITISFIVLLIYGVYINFIMEVPNFKTFLFTITMFGLFGLTLYLMRKHYGKS